MKNLFNFYLGLALIIFFFSCNNSTSDSVKNAKDSNAAKIDSFRTREQPSSPLTTILSKADADFLVNAASGGMMEVQLGQLAQTHSTNRRVKNFGAMMVNDHTKGLEALKALAGTKNVTLPATVSPGQQKEIDDLATKKGSNFDRMYIRLMVSDHKDDIKEFEKQASKGRDSLTRSFAGNSLEMLRKHLDSAGNLSNALGKVEVKGVPPLEP